MTLDTTEKKHLLQDQEAQWEIIHNHEEQLQALQTRIGELEIRMDTR